LSSLAWGDPDGDGDLDLAVSGAATSSPTISGNGRIYRNDGFGQFVEMWQFLGVVGGSLTWGDVNGDGRADLTAAGTHGVQLVNEITVNLGNSEFWPLPLQPGGTTWADARLLDWDWDGDLDLLGGVNSVIGLYLNPGTGEFPNTLTASASLRCRALRFADFDNDADFDVIVSNEASTGAGGQTRLYRNPRVFSAPPRPASLTATVDGDSVLLRWPQLPPSSGAPVTYNVRVGTGSGRGDVLSPLSRADGRRLVPQPGNAGFANQLRLRLLAEGTYYWSVQPVDVRWHGGAWLTEGKFTVTSGQDVRILSIEALSPGQVLLRYSAPAARTLVVEASVDLSSWGERTSLRVPIAGVGAIQTYVTGEQTFYRLSVQ
jgi:hypothetical protein